MLIKKNSNIIKKRTPLYSEAINLTDGTKYCKQRFGFVCNRKTAKLEAPIQLMTGLCIFIFENKSNRYKADSITNGLT